MLIQGDQHGYLLCSIPTVRYLSEVPSCRCTLILYNVITNILMAFMVFLDYFQTRSKPAWQQTAPSFQLSPNKRLAADAEEESRALGKFQNFILIVKLLSSVQV